MCVVTWHWLRVSKLYGKEGHDEHDDKYCGLMALWSTFSVSPLLIVCLRSWHTHAHAHTHAALWRASNITTTISQSLIEPLKLWQRRRLLHRFLLFLRSIRSIKDGEIISRMSFFPLGALTKWQLQVYKSWRYELFQLFFSYPYAGETFWFCPCEETFCQRI